MTDRTDKLNEEGREIETGQEPRAEREAEVLQDTQPQKKPKPEEKPREEEVGAAARVVDRNTYYARMARWLLLALILLLIGFWLFNMPVFASTYRDAAQRDMLASIKAGETSFTLDEKALQGGIIGDEELGYDEGGFLGEFEEGESEDESTIGLKGIIRIPSISLEMPLLAGANRSNLRFSICYDTKSAGAGGEGNFVVFGHRMKKRGRHFNRLDEVRLGDKISILMGEYEYVYTVDDIRPQLMPAEMLLLLRLNDYDRRISLVTCTPVGKGNMRLVVMGALSDKKPLDTPVGSIDTSAPDEGDDPAGEDPFAGGFDELS